jgi:2-polyprenyl-3-methyl-5-hydroxy-6-metoxy-1,4-benzoquinol methylase
MLRKKLKVVINKKASVKINSLGLPLEYQRLPEFFDAHNINEQTDSKNALIEKLLKVQNAKTVLDMTCGIGSQVFYLHDRGYEVVGSDFSPALIAQAREKASVQGKEITFLDGDVRNLQVGQFDAVITIFNAIGHLSKSDFVKALQNICLNLKDNGIYIFDIFNLDAITDNIIGTFKMDIESVVNGMKIRNIQHSEIDRKQGLLISHDRYTISKEGCVPETHTNSFSLQIYTTKELHEILKGNGFDIIHQYDMGGNPFVSDTSLSMLTVARKNML